MKFYHIYLEDKCLFKNVNEEEFNIIWNGKEISNKGYAFYLTGRYAKTIV